MKPRYLGKHNPPSRIFSLDRISRKESRKDLNKFESYGLDIWNAYEFSYLLNGKPKIIVLEISIPLALGMMFGFIILFTAICLYLLNKGIGIRQ